MQSLCAQLCSQLDVFHTLEQVRTIQKVSVDLPSLYRAVARDFGLPAFRRLSSGPQSRTDRIPRRFVTGQTGDIYEAVLAAVAYAGAGDQIAYDDLRSSLRTILLDVPPQKHEVTRAIQHMCDIARQMQTHNAPRRDQPEVELEENSGVDVPAVDWQEDTLQINDVFLRFYLRWIHRDSFGIL